MKPWHCGRRKRKEHAVFQVSPKSPALLLLMALTAGCGLACIPFAAAQGALTSDVVERGENFSVYRRVKSVADATGGGTTVTNQFTLLENCLNYFEDGQWKESDDVIETSANGQLPATDRTKRFSVRI